jgi:hypothetical protein
LGGAMRRVGMSHAELSVALERVNRDRCHCLPPLSPAKVQRIVASVARYPPDQVAVTLAEDHWGQMFDAAPAAVERAPEALDPGAVPVELLRIPGFVSHVMDHCLETAP